MNQAFVCAQLSENPREVFISSTATVVRCMVTLPPVGNKAPTTIEYNCYGKPSERFQQLTQGNLVYIHGAKLRYDLDARLHSLHGGVVGQVTESFPILNTVILAGRCVKDIRVDDERAFKTTTDGLMICNQTLAVNVGKNQSDLFNFFAINKNTDPVNNAELIANFTKKGAGLTLNGRLVTDAWLDKDSKQRRSLTKIQMVSMTLAPKGTVGDSPAIQPSTTVASDKVAPLWGGRTADEADPWQATTSLPDLPGQYNNTPDLEEVPF